MKKYKRKSVFSELSKYDIYSKEDDYIEVTEWNNGDGIDVEIFCSDTERFQLTYGQFRLLKKLVKELDE